MQLILRIGHACVAVTRYIVAWMFSLAIASLACFTIPLLGPRRMWTTFCGPWARTTLAILGIKPQMLGEPISGRPAVYIVNHQSILDVVLLPAILPATVVFVARRELMRVPFWGWAFMLGGAIAIDRRKNGSGDAQRIERALKTLPAGWSIVIFPEGTRAREAEPAPFRRGAFVTAAKLGYPVVPVGVARQLPTSPGGTWLLRSGRVPVCVGRPITVAGPQQEHVHAARDEGWKAVSRCVHRASPQPISRSPTAS